jgi:hypothetical protein
MTANIQQIGENLLGSLTLQPSSCDKYSGVIFGTVDGDKVKANYLSEGSIGGKDPQLAITFADSGIIDTNTLTGTYYVQDSNMNALSGPLKRSENRGGNYACPGFL